MIENIPYVPYMDVSEWPKELHTGYAKNVVRRIDENWDQESPSSVRQQEKIPPPNSTNNAHSHRAMGNCRLNVVLVVDINIKFLMIMIVYSYVLAVFAK